MTWQTKVAAWVIPLLTEYLIPDDAAVVSGVDFGNLEEAEGGIASSDLTFVAEYPGIVPNFSVDPEITPTTGGLLYNLKAKKAVGFHGVLTTVLSFDPKKLNLWTFPLVRRNFGYLALSKGDIVSLSESILYDRQFHLDATVFNLAANYDEQLNLTSLVNSVNKSALTKASVFQYPSVRTRVSFLPIWEVWAVKFFQS